MAEGDSGALFFLGFLGLLIWVAISLSKRPKSFTKRFVPMAAADRKQRSRWFRNSRYGLTDAQWHGGRTIPTRRGDLVRSRGEARVADHLYTRGFRYEYEPMICGWRPDFFLPDHGIVVEHWSTYSKNRRVKTAAYLRAGYALVSLGSGKGISVKRDIDRQLYHKLREMGLAPDGRTKRPRRCDA